MNLKSKALICSITAILGIAFAMPEIHRSQLSREGFALLAQAEGCRRDAYRCSANVWTTGIGHTTNVKLDSSLSDQQIARMFLGDVKTAETAVRRCINTRLTQFQYDSFVSLAFNIGSSAFCNSTLAKEANAGNINAACQELLRWVYASGKRVPGLENRRQRELEYCLRTGK